MIHVYSIFKSFFSRWQVGELMDDSKVSIDLNFVLLEIKKGFCFAQFWNICQDWSGEWELIWVEMDHWSLELEHKNCPGKGKTILQ